MAEVKSFATIAKPVLPCNRLMRYFSFCVRGGQVGLSAESKRRTVKMRPGLSRRRCLPLLGGTVLLFAGCAAPPQQAQPPNPAPPIPHEDIPLPPVSEEPLIWQPGHWNWTGTDYVWEGGAWLQRTGHGTQWQDGYWALEAGNWRWVPAHWL
jgi:hypothetical protein